MSSDWPWASVASPGVMSRMGVASGAAADQKGEGAAEAQEGNWAS